MNYSEFKKQAAAVYFLEKLAESAEPEANDNTQQDPQMPWEAPVVDNPQIGKPTFTPASRQRMTYYDPSKYTK